MAMHTRVFSRRCLDRASLAHIVRLGARLEAVALLLADLRRLPSWLCPALFDAMPSCLSFTPCLLPWAVLHACVSDPSTQSPDALFSIVLKPPTGVFSKHRLSVLLFHFCIRGFTKRRLGVFNPRPVVQNTDRGFPRTPTGFQSGFSLPLHDFSSHRSRFRSWFSVRVSIGVFSAPDCFCPCTSPVFYTSFNSFSPFRL